MRQEKPAEAHKLKQTNLAEKGCVQLGSLSFCVKRRSDAGYSLAYETPEIPL